MRSPRLPTIGMLVLLFACGTAKSPGVREATTPRQKATLLLEGGIGGADVEIVRALISPKYKQHNPRVADGPSGIIEFVDYFARSPVSVRPRVRVLRTVTDGDFVVTHAEYVRGGRQIVGFDMFRLEGGKLAEHWDAGMLEPEKTANGHSMVDGSLENVDQGASATNKVAARRFVDEVLVLGKTENIDAYVDASLVQHDPEIADGREAWKAALEKSANSLHRLAALRVFAEGSLVAVQSRAGIGATSDPTSNNVFNLAPAVVYDLFRFTDGKIVEHWSAFEEVPKESDNPNGMF